MNRIFSNQKDGGILYIVSTPIGNRKEITSRALDILSSCDIIFSEDTRTTGILLKEYQIKKPMLSCHEHNEASVTETMLSYLKEGKKIALTSDAGYPGISDPGEKVIKKIIENGFPISVINGPSAFLPALIGSGLSTCPFYFHGFLSSKSSLRKKELEKLKSYPMTLIFYEAPHRIQETLQDLYDTLGNRRLTIARELTKIYEEYIYTTLEEAKKLQDLKGELVLVLEGHKEENLPDKNKILSILKLRLKEENITKKDLAKEIADIYHLRKNEVYEWILELTKTSEN